MTNSSPKASGIPYSLFRKCFRNKYFYVKTFICFFFPGISNGPPICHCWALVVHWNYNWDKRNVQWNVDFTRCAQAVSLSWKGMQFICILFQASNIFFVYFIFPIMLFRVIILGDFALLFRNYTSWPGYFTFTRFILRDFCKGIDMDPW